MNKLQELFVKHDIKNPNCYSSIGDGWIPLVDRLFEDLIKVGWNKELDQVKEKFGTLRVYVGITTLEQQDLIVKAEKDSSTICERCGQLGTLRTDCNWLSVSCDECNTGR